MPSWTAVSDATNPAWQTVSDATNPAWTSSNTTDPNPWYQVSRYTLSSPTGDVNFMLYAHEQYPLYIYDDARAPLLAESGYSGPA